MMPIAIAPKGPTKPQAGVMATRPEMAPDAAPSMVGLPRQAHSPQVQATTAPAVATKVLRNTIAGRPVASGLEPTLKPNQPTRRRAAPVIIIGRLCGGIAVEP